jgi:hypothetical protein
MLPVSKIISNGAAFYLVDFEGNPVNFPSYADILYKFQVAS